MRAIGHDLHRHVEALFPVCRSITGDGLRQTLRYIGEHIPLQVSEIASGTRVLDWDIPLEWNVRGAWLRAPDGRVVVDFARNNLHLLQYSVPVDRVVSRDELEGHLYSLPDQATLIPYRTAYFAETWGFCLTERERTALTEAEYRVRIDTTLEAGSLSYGECVLAGQCEEEVLISAHCCHPSLANDNLSSIAVAIGLARLLAERPRRFTYRFLFAPGTIGAIAWLHANRSAAVPRIRHGLVLANLGDAGAPTWKRSRRGDAAIDRIVAQAMHDAGLAAQALPFEPYGYDERQFCSPGFDLPVGRLTRSPAGTFPEYHTSADNLDFVRPESLAGSFELLQRIVETIEADGTWINTCPYGEPQLGRRGLYAKIGGQAGDAGRLRPQFDQLTLLWVLNLSDGSHSLLDIAARAGKPFAAVAAAAATLREAGLLRRADDGEARARVPDGS